MVFRYALALLFCTSALSLSAQKEKTHWYFGIGAAISFEDGDPKVLDDNPQTDYTIASTCISDPKTGDLLFYMNGFELRDGNHKLVKDNFRDYTPNLLETIILEDPFIDGSYFLITMTYPGSSHLQYYTVNVGMDGEVRVSESPVNFAWGAFAGLSAVKNCRTGGYWLITYNVGTEQFMTFDVGFGISTTPVVSDAQMSIPRAGCITTNYTGEMVAISELDASSARVFTYHINKECGTLTFDQELNFPGGEYAHGLAFSENNKYLYATYSVGESDLVQFDLSDGSYNLIAHSNFNYNELQMGPDGRIYIATHEGGIPGPRIDAINAPDEAGASCLYEKGKLTLGDRRTTNFHLPNFLQDYSTETCERRKPDFEMDNVCFGETIEVNKKRDFDLPDSFFWVMGKDTLWEIEPNIEATELGEQQLSFVYLLCDEEERLEYTVEIGEVHAVDLGADTTICPGSSFELQAGVGKQASYLWRHDGSIDSTVTISEPGEYWVRVGSEGCYSKDSITIGLKSSVWLDLGGEYFLCEDENDLVKLDAGKGFATYEWLPTGDTTQWIHVAKIDSYYVIVEDFRGCKGEDGAAVSRRCKPFLFFPTAFSPNRDGLNEVFAPIGQDLTEYHLQVYNVWGELVFESTQLEEGWDGTFNGHESPVGQYLWICKYAGFKDKTYTKSYFKTGYLMLVE